MNHQLCYLQYYFGKDILHSLLQSQTRISQYQQILSFQMKVLSLMISRQIPRRRNRILETLTLLTILL